MLSKKEIHQLAEENKELLEAFKEFDRTGQLRKLSYKERVNFTIDEGVMAKFRRYCEKNNFKMSMIIEKLIQVELDVLELKESSPKPTKKEIEKIDKELFGIC